MELLDGRGDGFSVNTAATGVVVGEVPHGKVDRSCPGFGVVCGGFSNNLEARQVDAWGERLGVLWVRCLKKEQDRFNRPYSLTQTLCPLQPLSRAGKPFFVTVVKRGAVNGGSQRAPLNNNSKPPPHGHYTVVRTDSTHTP